MVSICVLENLQIMHQCLGRNSTKAEKLSDGILIEIYSISKMHNKDILVSLCNIYTQEDATY